jgi:hypothetical protein
MKFISPTIHGIIDYLSVLFLFAVPAIFGFTGIAATLTYVFAGAHLLMCLLTAYPLGLIKFLPVRAHAAIELVAGIAFIILAYTLFTNNVDNSKLFYVIAGTVILLTWLVTDYAGSLHQVRQMSQR